MRAAWRVADVRAAEETLMARLPAGALMQRAAAGLAHRCAVLLRDRGQRRYGACVVLLVGAGNNGGDTLYAGARLARRGAQVGAVLLDPRRAHSEGLAALRTAGGRVVGGVPDRADLVLDGIVGIGGRGGLRPDAAAVVADAARTGAPLVAVDTPSGIDVDTGAVAGAAVRADVTVTFGCLKPGLVVGPAAAYAGLVDLVDIGLGPHLAAAPHCRLLDAADVAAAWPRPAPDDDKYTRGVVGVATGSDRYTGAAVLSVGGALAGPAGFVRYAGSAEAFVRHWWPAAVVTGQVADAGRVQAWVAGSGLGTDEAAAAALRAVLAAPVPVCLDADAVTIVSADPEDWLRREAPVVVTPHDREYARLAGAPPGDDRIAAARDLAARLDTVVLLKGDRTVIAAPDGTVYVNSTGTAALATAGTGDVLAGLLGSVLAAGVPAAKAAAVAAFVHGLAGRYAAERGPVNAQNVAEALRPVVALLAKADQR